MITTFRFIKEYANFQKKQFKKDKSLYSGDVDRVKMCDNCIDRIDKAVNYVNRGYITVNECMAIIANPLTYSVNW